MKTISVIAVVTVMAIAIAGFGPAGTANAAHAVATITVPDVLQVGQPSQLQVTLLSANQPVANTLVTVYTDASFGGVTGEVEIGTITTNDSGTAAFEYEPRRNSAHELRFEFLAPGETEPTVATTTVSVAGTAQLYLSTSGIQIPGLNVWLIIGIISAVWFLLFSVAVRVLLIARAGPALRGVTS